MTRLLCVSSVFRPLDQTNLHTMQVPNESAFSKFFKEKVSLSQDDIERNSKIINRLIPEILASVCKTDAKSHPERAKFALKVLKTGNTDVIIKDFQIMTGDEKAAFSSPGDCRECAALMFPLILH